MIKTVLFILGVVWIRMSCATPPIQDSSLLHYTKKVYSQSGEEGVIDEILHRLKIDRGFFVEFGASDGISLSNTRFLADRGWDGAFIESDSRLIPKLLENCQILPKVKCIHEMVTASDADTQGRSFDAIADQYFANSEIDVLIIDIDGLDYLIFESLKRKPKIICIESSGYWHPMLKEKVPQFIAAGNLGQPLSVMIDIARKKGYEPVCFLTINLFLVRNDLYQQFSEIKNDPLTLWLESWYHMAKNSPGDQRYITQEREVNPNIKMYDHFPTPSPQG